MGRSFMGDTMKKTDLRTLSAVDTALRTVLAGDYDEDDAMHLIDELEQLGFRVVSDDE